jgi:hypothetical protein
MASPIGMAGDHWITLIEKRTASRRYRRPLLRSGLIEIDLEETNIITTREKLEGIFLAL